MVKEMSLDLTDPATLERLRVAIAKVIDERLDAARTAIRNAIDIELALIPMKQAAEAAKEKFDD